MKRILLLLFLYSITILATSARTFKIIKLNTPTINIGNKELCVNDYFNETEHIKWQSTSQAMKIKSDDNKIMIVSPSLFAQYNVKKFSDFIATVEPMIRRSGPIPVTLDDHRRLFNGCHVLMDSLTFNVGWRMDSSSFFYATTFDSEGNAIKISLPFEKDKIVITREHIDSIIGNKEIIPLTIHYYETDLDDNTSITNNMKLIVVPNWID